MAVEIDLEAGADLAVAVAVDSVAAAVDLAVVVDDGSNSLKYLTAHIEITFGRIGGPERKTKGANNDFSM